MLSWHGSVSTDELRKGDMLSYSTALKPNGNAKVISGGVSGTGPVAISLKDVAVVDGYAMSFKFEDTASFLKHHLEVS